MTKEEILKKHFDAIENENFQAFCSFDVWQKNSLAYPAILTAMEEYASMLSPEVDVVLKRIVSDLKCDFVLRDGTILNDEMKKHYHLLPEWFELATKALQPSTTQAEVVVMPDGLCPKCGKHMDMLKKQCWHCGYHEQLSTVPSMDAVEWISVEEKEAPKDVWLLVYNGNWTGVAKRKTQEDEYEPEWHDETNEYLNKPEYPTHWMPLPAPPHPNNR